MKIVFAAVALCCIGLAGNNNAVAQSKVQKGKAYGYTSSSDRCYNNCLAGVPSCQPKNGRPNYKSCSNRCSRRPNC